VRPSEAINPDPTRLTHRQQEGEQATPTSTARGKAEKRGKSGEKRGENGEKQQQRRFNAWVRKA